MTVTLLAPNVRKYEFFGLSRVLLLFERKTIVTNTEILLCVTI